MRIMMLTISKNEDDLLGAIAGSRWLFIEERRPGWAAPGDPVGAAGCRCSPQVTRQVLRSSVMPGVRRTALSSREMEVLVCLAQGKTTAQIANELYISENTVKTHVRHILEKLEASNRAEAVSKATQMGWIGSDVRPDQD
jgi:DNA-binding CsgD family transcriptional regulator